MAEVVARIGQPVARLGIRALDALVAHLRVQRNRHETGEKERHDETGTAGPECAHRVPRNPTRYATTLSSSASPSVPRYEGIADLPRSYWRSASSLLCKEWRLSRKSRS